MLLYGAKSSAREDMPPAGGYRLLTSAMEALMRFAVSNETHIVRCAACQPLEHLLFPLIPQHSRNEGVMLVS
jgi:hypothetical protein